MLKYDATMALASIKVPVAVVPGDLDTTCLPEASQFMARSIPKAELAPLSPARHMGLIERNDDFERALVGFAPTKLKTETIAG